MTKRWYLILLATLFATLLFACSNGEAPVEEAPVEEADLEKADPEEAMDEAFMASSPECIAPANPGGGWDFTCRAFTQALNESGAVEDGFKVTNMPGGGGGVAFANVVSERGDDDNLFIAASPATTLRLAQGQYGEFTAEDVRWLGAVGADFAVLAVAADSNLESMEDLVSAIQDDPSTLNFGGGSAVGGQDHMKVLILAQALGVDPLALSYTPFDGGGEALTSLLGGFIDVFPGDASEVIGQVEAGEVRVLAALTPERLAAPLDDVPTAKELGYDAEWIVFRGFYAPPNMSDGAYDYWVEVMESTANSDTWTEIATQGGLDPFWMGGAEFQSMIEDQVSNFRQLSVDLGIISGDASAGAESDYVTSSPECIAPANPGGGWDFTCRAFTQALNESGAVEDGFKVTNMPGGGGGVAFANVVSERGDDNDLLIAASPATTLRLAQGQYGEFTAEDVRWLGAVGADFAVLAVAADSDLGSMEDLVSAIQADPSALNFGGGSAVGGQDHMKVLILAQALGVDPLALSYTPFDGGGEALTSLLGGFIDVFPGDASEVLGQVEAGEVRVLAALTPERLAAPLDDVPTAKELGYEAEWIVFRGFYAPPGMSDDAYNYWVNVMESTATSDTWTEIATQGGLDPFWLGGAEFQSMIEDQVSNFRQLSIDLGIIAGESSAGAESDYVTSSPECIAPANPGGGWDFTCRAFTQALNESGAVEDGFKVTNMPGGGGGVAFANVVSERGDDSDLLIAASPATTLRLAQGQYGEFTAADVRWLGAVGADFAVLAVSADSDLQSMDDLVAALEADAGALNFGGGSAVGGQDHMKVLLLAQALGVDPLALSYTPFDGGGEALTSLLGGFIDVFPGDASEVIGQVEAGEVRVLAAMTQNRLAAPLDDVPTTYELGYEVEWIVFRGFYAAPGMSDDAYNYWVSVMEATATSDLWTEIATQGGLDPFWLGGAEFQAMIEMQVENFRQLSIDLGIIDG